MTKFHIMRDNENGNVAYPASAIAVEEDSEAEDVIMVEYFPLSR